MVFQAEQELADWATWTRADGAAVWSVAWLPEAWAAVMKVAAIPKAAAAKTRIMEQSLVLTGVMVA